MEGLPLSEFEASSDLGCVLCGMVHKVVMHFLGDRDVKDVGIVEIQTYASLEIWFTTDLKRLNRIDTKLYRPSGKEFLYALASPLHFSFYVLSNC